LAEVIEKLSSLFDIALLGIVLNGCVFTAVLLDGIGGM